MSEVSKAWFQLDSTICGYKTLTLEQEQRLRMLTEHGAMENVDPKGSSRRPKKIAQLRSFMISTPGQELLVFKLRMCWAPGTQSGQEKQSFDRKT